MIVGLGALLMTAGAVIAVIHPAMLVSPHDEINGAVRIYAGYLFSRNLALALVLLAALVFRSKRNLHTLMVLIAFMQFLDVALDCLESRWAVIPGVAVLGVLFLIGASAISGAPFWKRTAWTEH